MLDRPFIFKLNDGNGPNLLIQVFLERGWKEYNDDGMTKDNWNIWWRTGGIPTSQWKSLKAWQFTNHIPKGSSICRKDWLCRYLKCMKNTFGNIYDFSPDAYILPLDYTKLVTKCNSSFIDSKDADVWICKPVGQSRGRGITIFRKVSDLVYGTNSVVQRYVKNPLLIGGYKFDLRLYVCVPSFHPLTIYVYREGLARFSTDKFSLSDLTNRYAHLTNSSVNREGPGYSEMKERVGAGCKWSLKQLRYYLEQNGHDDWLLWQRISTTIILTIVSQLSGIPNSTNCFEFYGFDILIDSTLKPWLLEVNVSPALGTDCDLDPAVKKPMLHDLFDLLGFPVCNTGLSLFSDWSACTDDTDSSLDESASDNEYKSMRRTAKMAVNVVTLANKWKRQLKPNQQSGKQKKVSKLPNIQFKVVKSNRGKSSGRKKHFVDNFSEVERYIDPFYRTNRNSEWPKCRWDNGRDWRHPPTGEGDWVRIFPFRKKDPQFCAAKEIEGNYIGDKVVKDIVTKVTKFYKVARDVSSKNAKCSDRERDCALLGVPDLIEAVWHPYKDRAH